MALHSELEIYQTCFDLLGEAVEIVRNMRRDIKKALGEAPATDLWTTANSYFGLLRQASHSHRDRARLANVVRARGRSVNKQLTKTYWRQP